MTERYTDLKKRTHRVRHSILEKSGREKKEDRERRILAELARILLHARS